VKDIDALLQRARKGEDVGESVAVLEAERAFLSGGPR